MKAWWLAVRPKTLTAAVVPVAVGTSLAWAKTGSARLEIAGLCLVAAVAIQAATNLFNDALDFRRGADREGRLGPVRVTQAGLLSEPAVLRGAWVAVLVATAAGLPLVLRGGWPILAVGVVSLALAYLYTGGPAPLAYTGLADLFVLLFFGLVAVGGVYYLHTLAYEPTAVLAGLQVGLLCTLILLVNNLRDVEADRLSGKGTLVVRLGLAFGRWEAAFCGLMPFFLGGIWWRHGFLAAAFLPLLSFPFVWSILRGLWLAPPGPVYNRFLARAAAAHLAFGLLLAVGLLL